MHLDCARQPIFFLHLGLHSLVYLSVTVWLLLHEFTSFELRLDLFVTVGLFIPVAKEDLEWNLCTKEDRRVH